MRTITLLDDTVLRLHDVGEALSDHIAREQDYFERDLLDYVADKHPQHEVILDIGANIGNHTAYFAQYLEYSSIIAFEPIPENYNLLRQNIRFPNTQLRNEAVGATREPLHMYKNSGNMGASQVDANGDIKVTQIRVDDLFLIKPVTLMKIDVEWYEPQVLAGATNIIAEDRPLILIEDTEEKYMSLLDSMGYQLEVVWPQHRTYLYRSKDA